MYVFRDSKNLKKNYFNIIYMNLIKIKIKIDILYFSKNCFKINCFCLLHIFKLLNSLKDKMV